MKTNKTFVYGIFAVIIALAFAACDNNPEPGHVHQWGEWDVTAPATCIATGSQTRTCTLDATHTETEVIPIDTVNGHDWGEWEGTVTCTEAGTGTRVCSRSEAHTETNDNLQPLGHNYEYEETTAPTCTTEGEETGNCTHDNSHTTTRPKAIDPNAHNWQLSPTATAPTCTEDGNGDQICSYNEAHIQSGVIPKLGHDSGDWHTTIEPDCTTAGSKELRCTRDDAVLNTDTIDPIGHAWEWISTATVTADGTETEICRNNQSHTGETRTAYATGTVELMFEAISSTAYRVSKGTVSSGAVYIPAYHRLNADNPYLPVTEIGANAFRQTSITAVTFVEGSRIETIRDEAFGYTDLTNVEIPESVISIGGQAFNNCESLTSVTILASVTSIDIWTFGNCKNLTSINIPESVKSIGHHAFYSCEKLSALTIPEGVESIDMYAFDSCIGITGSITIPASVMSIGRDAFRNCTNLAVIIVDANNPNYSSEDGIVYNKAKTEIVAVPAGISGNVTIPTGVTSIAYSAFMNYTGLGLTSITIPASVTSIGNFAFYGWTSSQTIYVEGFASQTEADTALGGDSYWRNGCDAVIKYWNGSEYQ